MNVAFQLESFFKKTPNKPALIVPRYFNHSYKSLSFCELESKIIKTCTSFKKRGISPGQKVLIFLKPGLDLAPVVFACFRYGLVCVFIDPGMGMKKFLKAIEESRATLMIGIFKARLLAKIKKSHFKYVKNIFSVNDLLKTHATECDYYQPQKNELAALLYTSGGTGKPKPVEYTHDIFISQTKKLQTMFDLSANDTDLPGFPLFSFFTLAMGMTSCIPYMNPAKPAKAKAKHLLKNIQDHKVSFVAGSPAIWKDLIEYCLKHEIKLLSVKNFVMFGAPISLDTHKKLKTILPNGFSYAPYGATESLPIAYISGCDLIDLNSKSGQGICVGHEAPGVETKIIDITDKELSYIEDCSELSANQIGEIIVRSNTTTRAYHNMPKKTSLSKIKDGHSFWHRMGDTGYKDKEGKLWFCGRVAHSFLIKGQREVVIPKEQFFLEFSDVEKAAFVKLGDDKTAMILQTKNITEAHRKKTKELGIDHCLKFETFPLDVRHNIKIDRKILTDWANQEVYR